MLTALHIYNIANKVLYIIKGRQVRSALRTHPNMYKNGYFAK